MKSNSINFFFLKTNKRKSKLNYFPLPFLFYCLLCLFTACKASRPGISARQINKRIKSSPVFSQYFSGFALYDLQAGKMIADNNASKYFTPASNTKIFTFYTSLRMLGDSIPAFKYIIKNDSLIFRGTGDPSFLHQDFKSTRGYEFLAQQSKQLFYAPASYSGYHLGPGWAWSDFNGYYSAEKSTFPIYGNIVRFQVNAQQEIDVYPGFFRSALLTTNLIKPVDEDYIQRKLSNNTFTYYPDVKAVDFTQDIPFQQSTPLLLELLSDTLHKDVQLIENLSVNLPGANILYSLPADTLYKKMMQESDNFIAEQLLLVCSSTLSDSLSSERTIKYAAENFLNDLPDRPIWKDGSGLSRYNLFTPRSIVSLLLDIYKIVPQERLFTIFPAGGVSGTIKSWYKSDAGKPYVFAKTGTLSNVHCLSGYLVTRKGRTLVFSFMHNNYTISTNEIRQEMSNILKELHEKY